MDSIVFVRLISDDPKDYRKFFPHGTSHYVGLDVHDPGTTGPYRANSIITVEPGPNMFENSNYTSSQHSSKG